MNPEDGMKLLRDPKQWDLELAPRVGAFPVRSRASVWTTAATVAVAATAIVATAAIGIGSLQSRPPVAAPAPTSTGFPAVPELPAYTGTATCTNLLDPATVEQFEANGWVDAGETYTREMASKNSFIIKRFLEYGGIVCKWGPQDGSAAVEFSFGPISAEWEAGEREEAVDSSGVLTSEAGWDVYTFGELENPTQLVFRDGYWALAFDNNAGAGRVIDDIMRNAPR